MESLHFVDACTSEHFSPCPAFTRWAGGPLSGCGAGGVYGPGNHGRSLGAFPSATITNRAGHGLLLYNGNTSVVCCNYGPARAGGRRLFRLGRNHFLLRPSGGKGRGYGGLLMEEALRRLRISGFSRCYVLVLRENENARRFYSDHGFAWDGTQVEIPFRRTPSVLISGMQRSCDTMKKCAWLLTALFLLSRLHQRGACLHLDALPASPHPPRSRLAGAGIGLVGGPGGGGPPNRAGLPRPVGSCWGRGGPAAGPHRRHLPSMFWAVTAASSCCGMGASPLWPAVLAKGLIIPSRALPMGLRRRRPGRAGGALPDGGGGRSDRLRPAYLRLVGRDLYRSPRH